MRKELTSKPGSERDLLPVFITDSAGNEPNF